MGRSESQSKGKKEKADHSNVKKHAQFSKLDDNVALVEKNENDKITAANDSFSTIIMDELIKITLPDKANICPTVPNDKETNEFCKDIKNVQYQKGDRYVFNTRKNYPVKISRFI